MEPVLVALTLLSAYLLGSIPTGYIVGRVFKGIDIRTVGNRNVGALNVLHSIGRAAAIGVLAVDTLQGSLATLMAVWVIDAPGGSILGGIGVVAGHNWPVFLGFRGGKGAATVLGVSLAVQPWLTLIAIAPTVTLASLTRNLVLAAAVGFVILNVLTVVTGQGLSQILLCLALTFVVTATYLARSWRQTVAAAKSGRWADLFFFE